MAVIPRAVDMVFDSGDQERRLTQAPPDATARQKGYARIEVGAFHESVELDAKSLTCLESVVFEGTFYRAPIPTGSFFSPKEPSTSDEAKSKTAPRSC